MPNWGARSLLNQTEKQKIRITTDVAGFLSSATPRLKMVPLFALSVLVFLALRSPLSPIYPLPSK